MLAAIPPHLGVDALGRMPERQLAERDEVAFPEEVAGRLRRLLRDVDLAFLEPLAKVLDRKVDQLDLVGLLEDRVRHRLAHDDPGDLRDDVVERFEVLDVDRRVDVDPRVQQLHDVLPALGVTTAGSVGVRQLVDEDDGRATGEGGVEVQLPQCGAAILDRPGRQNFETLEQRFRLGASVRLHDADEQVQARRPLLTRRLQHRVRLAHAGSGAEEHLQLATVLTGFFLLGPSQESFGITPAILHGRRDCTSAREAGGRTTTTLMRSLRAAPGLCRRVDRRGGTVSLGTVGPAEVRDGGCLVPGSGRRILRAHLGVPEAL